MKQNVDSLQLEHQQQLQAQADEQSSKQEAHVTHMTQLLEQAQASLAAEKQRSAALKVGTRYWPACHLAQCNNPFSIYAVALQAYAFACMLCVQDQALCSMVFL